MVRRQQTCIADALGKPGTVGTDTLDDDQRWVAADAVGDPVQRTVQVLVACSGTPLDRPLPRRGGDSANEWVAAWVSTPMTNRYCSATMGIATD
jgi:hypothetical protein